MIIMKLRRVFAAALLSVLAVAFDAHAMAINPSPLGSLDSPLVAGDSGKYQLTAFQGSSIVDTLNGYLDANTMITITYSYSGLNPYYLSIDATGANEEGQTTASIGAVDYPGTDFTVFPSSTTATAPGLPLAVMADLTEETGTAIIENKSSAVASFSSLFKAFVFGDNGSLTVSYNVTAIPLPPAAVLFLIGLLSMAGFGLYRKAREQA